MSMTLRSDQSLVTPHEIVRSYMGFLEALDTPVALAVWIQLNAGDHDAVVTRKIDPRDYQSATVFRMDYQAMNGLRKAAFLKTSFDKRVNAHEKFKKSEESCRVTNQRFDNLMYGGGWEQLASSMDAKDALVFSTLSRAKRLIQRILGPIPEKLNFRFGPGVTSTVKRYVTLPKKYASVMDVTPQLFDSLLDVIGPLWARHLRTINLVRGCQIAFVPKDSETDRTIGIEPHLCGYVQLGLGAHLRDRFRPWVDLDTGQEVNRFLASVAADWRLATVDLKAASDTISRSLVWFLLPEEWVTLLDKCRSHYFTLEGETKEFEKFSSMGNGFTFELESIIFYALARAVGSSRQLTATYGDDIICEAKVFDDLQTVLEYCGFAVNWDKSFLHSAFYESCGADFFNGVNVRPFLWKENKPSLLFKMANDISRFARLDSGGRDQRFRQCHSWLTRRLSSKGLKLLVPEGVGDIGFICDFDVALPHVRRLPNGWCGFSIKALKYRPSTQDHSRDESGLLSQLDSHSPHGIEAWLYPLEKDASQSVVRGEGVYQVGRITVSSQWNGHGPWVQ